MRNVESVSVKKAQEFSNHDLKQLHYIYKKNQCDAAWQYVYL